jgi:DNA helicase HerA-like ATPase
MQTNSSLGSRIVAEGLQIQRLLREAKPVGGIYTMGYDDCLVLTNDLWKQQAGGVPQHCFLLATAMKPGETPNREDEEVILLRVGGPAALPSEAELVEIRAEAMRNMVTERGREEASSPSAIIDVLTRNEIQFSGLKAKVLGTFYDEEVSGHSILKFGSDVETFYAASKYIVYKPFGDSLGIISSYPEITEEEEEKRQEDGVAPSRVQLGTVRYSSSQRRRKRRQGGDTDTASPVRVKVEDFISMKTAVFGMTRLGKSNTMKIIATSVFQHAAQTNQRIGQLLFDPAGEYANVNVQDETALAELGSEHVTVFRYGADGDEEGVRPLTLDFFSDETIGVTRAIIAAHLRSWEAGYVDSFLAADVIGPERREDDWSAFNRAERRRGALYATLLKADFEPPQDWTTTFVVSGDTRDAVNSHLPEEWENENGEFEPFNDRGRVRFDARELQIFWDSLLEALDSGEDLSDWTDAGLDAILTMYRGTVGRGYRLLEPLRIYHAPGQEEDYASEVLNELVDGKIVIVDLSRGSESVLQFSSERIVNHILSNAAQRFRNGLDPHKIQIYIEEAHRLFNRDKMNAPSETDPYVRLAKEAAKFEIGLIYATQEVSSVDPLILSNTSNWIVTHLNNHAEVKELSKYYRFEDFAELTLKAEDIGFARIKTRSGRYIIPTQIDLFSEDRVRRARETAQQADASN